MALTKEEVREAFREAMAKDYADVPPENEINHEFSPEFYAKMDALIEEQRRGSWRLLNRQTRRALIVAAILTLSLLLTACSPKLREAFVELVVTVYESFAEFKSDSNKTALQTEIEVIYELNLGPEGFEMISREWIAPHVIRSIFENRDGHRIIITQSTMAVYAGASDTEYSNSSSKIINGIDVFIVYATEFSSAQMHFDGYYFRIVYHGPIAQDEFENLLVSLKPNT